MPPEADDFISRTQGDILIVRFKTESLFNGHEIERIQNRLFELINGGAHKLVLDFKNVRFLSSAALGMVIGLQQRLTELRGKMVISHPESLTTLLQVSKTEKLFTLAADPKQAIKLF